MRLGLSLAASALLLASAAQAQIRDHLEVVTSAAAFPMAAKVSEAYRERFNMAPPKVFRSGSGAAIEVFCGGLGGRFPDVVLTSRPMSDSEITTCKARGVRQLVRAKLGYEAYAVVAHPDSPLESVTDAQLYGALGQLVADGNSLIPNNRESWTEVASSLPDIPIRVYAPSAASPTWDAFVNLVLIEGCETAPAFRSLSTSERFRTCIRMRTDENLRRYREGDATVFEDVRNQGNAVAIMDLATHRERAPDLKALAMNGVMPSIQSVSDGEYPAARPIYAYVKAQHYEHVPGLLEYVDELTSRRAVGHDGYLREAGLTPLATASWQAERRTAIGMNPMNLTQ
jgi:phosphate transport system substrate-binding protein